MAKLFRPVGFTSSFRIDQIKIVDKIKDKEGNNLVRVFVDSTSHCYELNCLEHEDAAEKTYNDIVKAIEEL